MTLRMTYLNGKLFSLCGPDGRLVPPRGMGQQAQADELAALGRALDRLAPASGYEAWWTRFEDALMGAATTRAWPLIGDVERAAKALRDAEKAKHSGAPAAKTDLGEIRKAQLLRWCRGEGPCADYLITRGNLEALAAEGLILRSEVEPMLDFAARSHGITPEAESLRRTGNLPPSLMREDTDAGIREEIEAAGARLRGTGIRNPAFAGAAE